MSVILLDIEGTTTPITFVYDELFPYARRAMHAFFDANASAARVQDAIVTMRAEALQERADGHDAPAIPSDGSEQDVAKAAADFALWQMDHDRKATGLKQVQGWIWADGYKDGELKGAVYDDVPAAIARWRGQGRRVAIYSSGSVEAQKLIFGYSTAGDLTPHLCGYFDTTTGPKKEASSYVAIAQSLGVAPSDVVFCSDNIDEIRAADDAGMRTRLTIRPGNPAVPANDFTAVTDFSEAQFGF